MKRALPDTVHDLINYLDELYPHACIAADEPETTAHRRAGARQVVDYLIQLRDKNTTSALEKHRNF